MSPFQRAILRRKTSKYEGNYGLETLYLFLAKQTLFTLTFPRSFGNKYSTPGQIRTNCLGKFLPIQSEQILPKTKPLDKKIPQKVKKNICYSIKNFKNSNFTFFTY